MTFVRAVTARTRYTLCVYVHCIKIGWGFKWGKFMNRYGFVIFLIFQYVTMCIINDHDDLRRDIESIIFSFSVCNDVYEQ